MQSQITANDLYKELCTQLPPLESRIILRERAGLEWSTLISTPDAPISADIVNRIKQDLEQRLAGKPLSRIYGTREFWGLSFNINEDTLDPRPDSETLIEVALKHYKDKQPETILDLGTGSGCLLLALLSEFKQARGIGVDIASGALKMAQENAQILGLAGRASFINADWSEPINGQFDLIVANPPYIESDVIQKLAKEVRNHDPIQALDGGKDGLQDYNRIFSNLSSLLKPDGMALFEIGFDQAEKLSRLSEKHRLSCGRTHADLAGNPRVVEIFL